MEKRLFSISIFRNFLLPFFFVFYSTGNFSTCPIFLYFSFFRKMEMKDILFFRLHFFSIFPENSNSILLFSGNLTKSSKNRWLFWQITWRKISCKSEAYKRVDALKLPSQLVVNVALQQLREIVESGTL